MMVGFQKDFLWTENLGPEKDTCIPVLLIMRTHVFDFFPIQKCSKMCTPKTGTRPGSVDNNPVCLLHYKSDTTDTWFRLASPLPRQHVISYLLSSTIIDFVNEKLVSFSLTCIIVTIIIKSSPVVLCALKFFLKSCASFFRAFQSRASFFQSSSERVWPDFWKRQLFLMAKKGRSWNFGLTSICATLLIPLPDSGFPDNTPHQQYH